MAAKKCPTCGRMVRGSMDAHRKAMHGRKGY